jgi:hypothetical protein
MFDTQIWAVKSIIKALRSSPNEEIFEETLDGDKIIQIQTIPGKAMSDIKNIGTGIEYDEFKEKYPKFVELIESSGWTYTRKNDTSLGNDSNEYQ